MVEQKGIFVKCQWRGGARHFFAFSLWFNAAGLLTLPGC